MKKSTKIYNKVFCQENGNGDIVLKFIGNVYNGSYIPYDF